MFWRSSYKVVLAVLVAALIFNWAIFHFLVAGRPYETARAFLEQHPTVLKELGAIEEIDLSWRSSASISGNSGAAELRCPVKGASGSAVAFVDLRREAGVWRVVRANLVVGSRSVALM